MERKGGNLFAEVKVFGPLSEIKAAKKKQRWMIIVHLPNSKLYRKYSDDNGNIIKKTSDDTILCPRSETPAAAGSSTFRHSCPLSDHQWWQLLLFDFRVKCSTLPKISVPHIDVLVLQHFKFRQLPSKTFFSVHLKTKIGNLLIVVE